MRDEVESDAEVMADIAVEHHIELTTKPFALGDILRDFATKLPAQSETDRIWEAVKAAACS
jgi:hypothetical protein